MAKNTTHGKKTIKETIQRSAKDVKLGVGPWNGRIAAYKLRRFKIRWNVNLCMDDNPKKQTNHKIW